jgi:hypothetical protein
MAPQNKVVHSLPFSDSEYSLQQKLARRKASTNDQQQKHRLYIHGPSGIPTHDPSVTAAHGLGRTTVVLVYCY